MNQVFLYALLGSSILLFLSIFASKSTQRFGIPALLVFLAVGMLAGSDGIGGINFDNPLFAQILGTIALSLIMFSGGLDTKWESVRPIVYQGISLSTLGVVLTAVTVGLFVHLAFDFTLIEGLLLGSIVSSTDAAAVFSILRTRGVGLKGQLRPTLELESGSNDPMAYLLTTMFVALAIDPIGTSLWGMIPFFFIQIILGAASGYLLGKLMIRLINNINLQVEGLYPVLLIAFVFFVYSFTEIIQGNGFLAIYSAALVLGNSSFIHKKSMLKFFDASAWLMQILMFLTLGLLVFPSELITFAIPGIIISVFMILIARPLAVYISLSFSNLRNKDKLFLSWVGLRGAVPIVFATFPLVAGVGKASDIFNIVFFIAVVSIALQGTTLSLVAKWLHLAVAEDKRRKYPLDLELSDSVKKELAEVIVLEGSLADNHPIVDLNFPKNGLIVMIKRGDSYIPPNGATVLKAGDIITVMADNEDTLEAINDRLAKPASVPVPFYKNFETTS